LHKNGVKFEISLGPLMPIY